MKKIYIQPAILITRVNVERMVASSPYTTEEVAEQAYGMDTKEEEDWELWDEE